MIVHPAGFVLLDPPKCACTAVFTALGQTPDGPWHQREIPAESAGLPRVALVRNPYDRAVSLFHFERHMCVERQHKPWYPGGHVAFFERWGLGSLTEFLTALVASRSKTERYPDERTPTGDFEFTSFLPCGLFHPEVDVVIHAETLQEEWDAVDWLPKVAFERVREGRYVRHGLTAGQRELVRLWATEDFERFGYGV